MAEKFKARAEGQGPDRRRHVRLRPVDDLGGLRRAQADEGRLPLQQPRPQRAPLHGLGRGGLHAHLRHRRADGLLRRHRGRRRLRAVGLEHGGDAPDPVDAGDRPAALSAPHVKVAVLSTFEHRSLRAGRHRRSSFTPQTDLAILNYIANHIIKTSRVNQDFVDKHTTFRRGNDRHRLRPAARASAAEGGEERRATPAASSR